MTANGSAKAKAARFETMLGARVQRPMDAVEEHHGGCPEDTPLTRGTVILIAAVYCRFAPRPDSDSGTRYPIPGSAVLTEVESADGWPAEPGDERFVGLPRAAKTLTTAITGRKLHQASPALIKHSTRFAFQLG